MKIAESEDSELSSYFKSCGLGDAKLSGCVKEVAIVGKVSLILVSRSGT